MKQARLHVAASDSVGGTSTWSLSDVVRTRQVKKTHVNTRESSRLVLYNLTFFLNFIVLYIETYYKEGNVTCLI
jgi:hypothetical protein